VDRLARLQLARAAREFAARSNSSLSGLVLLTDDERMTDPLASISALPRGSLVVLRARDPARRTALARSISRIARTRSLRWVIADDPALAAKLGAHGAHFPARKLALAARWRRPAAGLDAHLRRAFSLRVRTRRSHRSGRGLPSAHIRNHEPSKPQLHRAAARASDRNAAVCTDLCARGR